MPESAENWSSSSGLHEIIASDLYWLTAQQPFYKFGASWLYLRDVIDKEGAAAITETAARLDSAPAISSQPLVDGQDIPLLERDGFSLLKLIVDSRKVRPRHELFLDRLASEEDKAAFDKKVLTMSNTTLYVEQAARLELPYDKHFVAEVERWVIYAKAARSRQELAGIPASLIPLHRTIGSVVIPQPRLCVGGIYKRNGGLVRIAGASILTPNYS